MTSMEGLALPETAPSSPAERLVARYPGAFVGIDEAGRGPLAGPVVAAAVVLDPARPIPGLNDSKALSEKKREALYPQILEHALAVGRAVVEADEIDTLNILQATLTGMKRACLAAEAALGAPVQAAVIDGNQRAPLPQRIAQATWVGGDAACASIMAASIVAKVERDRRMCDEAKRYPAYGFERHKGYGTKVHMAALEAHGPTPLHRHTFAPVRRALAART